MDTYGRRHHHHTNGRVANADSPGSRRTVGIIAMIVAVIALVAVVGVLIYVAVANPSMIATASRPGAFAAGNSAKNDRKQEQLQQAQKTLPVVGMSGNAAGKIDEVIKSLPAAGRLPKPAAPKPAVVNNNVKVTATAPATCPAAYYLAPPPAATSKCTTGRATLSLGTDYCATQFNTSGIACAIENSWSIQKTANRALTADTPVCSAPEIDMDYTVQINAVKSVSANKIFDGSALLRITNAGTCAGKIASLLFLLEKSGIAPGSGNSYGPSGENHLLFAVSGVENAATAGQCIGSPTSATICFSYASLACAKEVAFAPSTVHPAGSTTGLDLAQYTVPAAASCANVMELAVDFNFVIDSATYASMLAAGTTGYRVNVLATFDTCCDRGTACGINLDCSANGSLETIRTVQIRSPSFNLPLACAERCSCVSVNDTESWTPTADSACSASPVPLTPLATYATCGTSSVLDYPLAPGPCCNNLSSAYGCNHHNYTFRDTVCLSPGSGEQCVSYSGASLLGSCANASMRFECHCTPFECSYYDNGLTPCFHQVTKPNDCGGSIECSRPCARGFPNDVCMPDNTCVCVPYTASHFDNGSDECFFPHDFSDGCGGQVHVERPCADPSYTCTDQNKCIPPVTPTPTSTATPTSATTPTAVVPSPTSVATPSPTSHMIPAPACTWTGGMWQQTVGSCTGSNAVTCTDYGNGTRTVSPASALPRCVPDACYTGSAPCTDVNLTIGDVSTPRSVVLNTRCIGDAGACDVTTTFRDLVASVWTTATPGPISIPPTNNVWNCSTDAQNTGSGNLAGQLTVALANRALMTLTKGAAVAAAYYDTNLINLTLCLNASGSLVPEMITVQSLFAVAQKIISASVTVDSAYCNATFDPASSNGRTCNYIALLGGGNPFSTLTMLMDYLNKAYDNCQMDTTSAAYMCIVDSGVPCKSCTYTEWSGWHPAGPCVADSCSENFSRERSIISCATPAVAECEHLLVEHKTVACPHDENNACTYIVAFTGSCLDGAGNPCETGSPDCFRWNSMQSSDAYCRDGINLNCRPKTVSEPC